MIQLGDVFATENPMALGKAINAVQTFTSKDNASRYSHTGVLTSPFGDALEIAKQQGLDYAMKRQRKIDAQDALKAITLDDPDWEEKINDVSY